MRQNPQICPHERVKKIFCETKFLKFTSERDKKKFCWTKFSKLYIWKTWEKFLWDKVSKIVHLKKVWGNIGRQNLYYLRQSERVEMKFMQNCLSERLKIKFFVTNFSKLSIWRIRGANKEKLCCFGCISLCFGALTGSWGLVEGWYTYPRPRRGGPMREDLVCGWFLFGGCHTSHLADKGANKEKLCCFGRISLCFGALRGSWGVVEGWYTHPRPRRGGPMWEDLVCGWFLLGGYHTSHLTDKGANKEKLCCFGRIFLCLGLWRGLRGW